MRNLLVYIFLVIFLGSCSDKNSAAEQSETDQKAQVVIDKAIETHGGEKFNSLKVDFDFRDRHYTSIRNNGLYIYTRSFTDSTGQVLDILNNDGFSRKINGQKVNLPEERKSAFTESVNSVIYFALLPFGLNDPAVQKEYLGETTIKGQPYHEIKVTFKKEGGGVDFEDEFVYWIHQQNHTIDYLAYSYNTDESGLRFREAYNPQQKNGIRFQQYINYEPLHNQVKVADLDSLFEAGKLKELSRIELKNIQVKK